MVLDDEISKHYVDKSRLTAVKINKNLKKTVRKKFKFKKPLRIKNEIFKKLT